MFLKKRKKFTKVILIICLVTSWMLAGWPPVPIPQFPREIKETKAAAVQALYAEGIDVVATDTNWVTAASISAGSFTAGKKYLILAQVITWESGSQAEEHRMRVIHGGTPTVFTDSTLAYEKTTNVMAHQGYMTVFEQPGTAEVITVQISSTSTADVQAKLAQVWALNLTDNLTENTDWYFTEVTTDYTTTTAFSGTDSTEGASVTFTPNGTDDWMVIGNASYDVAAVDSNHRMSIYESVANADEPAIDVEGEDATNETRGYTLMRPFTPTNAAHTFTTRFSHETVAHTVLSSRIFALNLNKFRQHNISYAAAEEAPAASPTWTTTRTLSPTPDVTGDWFIFGYFGDDHNVVTDELSTRLQIMPVGVGLPAIRHMAIQPHV